MAHPWARKNWDSKLPAQRDNNWFTVPFEALFTSFLYWLWRRHL
jgi:hypothetical protein